MGNENENNAEQIANKVTGVNLSATESLGKAREVQQGIQQSRGDFNYSSTDSPYIKDLEEWGHYSHEDIHTMVNSTNSGMMRAHADKWLEISTALSGSLFGLTLSIQRELSEGFDGQFANAAADASDKFIQQSNDIHEVISSSGARINAAAYGAEAAKLAVPPPDQSSPPPPTDLGGLLGVTTPAAALAADKAKEEQRQLAIAAMRNNYDTTYKPAGENVPTFGPVNAPGDSGPNVPGSGVSNSGNGTSSPGGTTPSENGPNPGDTENKSGSEESQHADGKTDPAGLSQTSPASNQPGGQGTSVPGSAIPGSSTRPAGLDSTAPSGFGGGGPGIGGGYSGGPGGSGRSVPGSPGRSVPGTPGTENPAAAAAAAGKPGKPGLGGMHGMGGLGGARKPEDSEDEHKTPDYLVMDREDELIGYIDPAVPGAIGANIPAAQPRPDEGEGRRR